MVMNLIVAATVVQVAGALLAGAAIAGGPQTARLDADHALARSEKAIGRGIGAHTLTDATGAPLSLASYRGKPLIISLVYSSCSSICPTTTQHLITAVGEARRVLGADRFEVLTVGFDARHDTPARMTQFAAVQGIKLSNWRVASADAGTLSALLGELGFSYAAAAGGFDHIAQTTIIDANGRIYRHVYGDDFPLQMLVEPLKYLIYGGTPSLSISSLIDRLRFICTTYDPAAARYRIDYGLAFGSVIAAMTLVAFGGLLLREWQRARRA
jgi:protein SCO1/2